MKKHIIFGIAVAALCAVADPADPQITSLSVAQNETTRRVMATYTLDEPAIITLDVLTNGVSIGGENIQFVSGDCNKLVQPTGQGETHTIYWQPDKSWPGHKLENAYIRVEGWSPDSAKLYRAENTNNCDVLYYNLAGQIPDGIGAVSQIYAASSQVPELYTSPAWDIGLGWTDAGRTTTPMTLDTTVADTATQAGGPLDTTVQDMEPNKSGGRNLYTEKLGFINAFR